MGSFTWRTSDFCAKGPTMMEPLELTDFLTGNRNPLAQVIDQVQLALKIRNIGYDRIFEAYCEFRDDTTFAFGCHRLASGLIFDAPGSGPTGVINVEIPENAQEIRIHYVSSGWNGDQGIDIFGDGLIANTKEGSAYWDHPGDVCIVSNFPRAYLFPAGRAGVVQLYSNKTTVCDVDVCLTGPAITEYDAPAQPAPDGLEPRARGTYETIADLGRELDNLEYKLELVADAVRFGNGNLILPPGAVDEPVEILPEEELDLGDAIGFIVHSTGVPPSRSSEFGTPQRYFKMGYVVMGSADGWAPPIELSHTPLLVMPIPPGMKKVRVNAFPPITSTVQMLHPQK